MNKADLIEALAPRLGGKAAATLAVEAFADIVMREVATGGSIGISGFGTFERVERAARTGRNPRTGEAVPIDATTSPRFRPGAYFKDVVTDPAKLPKDGLAGARVGSDAAAPAPSGAPASVRRAAQPKTAAKTTAAKTTAAKPSAAKTTAAKTTAAKSARTAPASKSGSTGTPATVRATGTPAPTTAPQAATTDTAPPKGRVMSGGEEITQKLLSAKKAQLARVKDDTVGDKDKKSGKKDKKAKKDKGKKKGKKSGKKDKKD